MHKLQDQIDITEKTLRILKKRRKNSKEFRRSARLYNSNHEMTRDTVEFVKVILDKDGPGWGDGVVWSTYSDETK
jgi:hypothetical protein